MDYNVEEAFIKTITSIFKLECIPSKEDWRKNLPNELIAWGDRLCACSTSSEENMISGLTLRNEEHYEEYVTSFLDEMYWNCWHVWPQLINLIGIGVCINQKLLCQEVNKVSQHLLVIVDSR